MHSVYCSRWLLWRLNVVALVTFYRSRHIQQQDIRLARAYDVSALFLSEQSKRICWAAGCLARHRTPRVQTDRNTLSFRRWGSCDVSAPHGCCSVVHHNEKKNGLCLSPGQRCYLAWVCVSASNSLIWGLFNSNGPSARLGSLCGPAFSIGQAGRPRITPTPWHSLSRTTFYEG
jgi:hypothetical protein